MGRLNQIDTTASQKTAVKKRQFRRVSKVTEGLIGGKRAHLWLYSCRSVAGQFYEIWKVAIAYQQMIHFLPPQNYFKNIVYHIKINVQTDTQIKPQTNWFFPVSSLK